ncbi:GTP-binding protein [Cellvibrio sp. PSBB023]|uniref:CobW family GTP-binding protein n=1 Tax=Cellvibrio sp. PSBB023 TaxID=1945512 RepID=UPI00098E9D73|nr:GTP-binding protein [Cellvibrio sp. PSBB023]AQT62040.1 GTP-binding protein [Cellvibrio sp. PSBB023]
MNMKERIPVYLLTGFLGSGKTTLLNSLVKQPGMERTLILINEFGEVGLDHLLVSHSTEDIVVELDSGCLCCTTRGDFAKTLRDIPWRYSREGERSFDRVIIETTGLADPTSVIHTLMTDHSIYLQFRLQGVVTTVDAVNGEATLERHIESSKQVGVADLLLVTKTDLIDDEKIVAEFLQQLAELNPTADVRVAEGGTIGADIILQLDHIEPMDSATPLNQWLNITSFSIQPTTKTRLAFRELTPASTTQNDINRHNDHIQAQCFVFDTPFTEASLDMWLEIITKLMGPNLLRLKGIINVQGFTGPVVIHGVQHIFHPAALLPEWPDEDHRTKLVFITYDTPREFIERSFDLFASEEEKKLNAAPQPENA